MILTLPNINAFSSALCMLAKSPPSSKQYSLADAQVIHSSKNMQQDSLVWSQTQSASHPNSDMHKKNREQGLGSRSRCIDYCREGESRKSSSRRSARRQRTFLDGASDWEVLIDLEEKLIFPPSIVVTNLSKEKNLQRLLTTDISGSLRAGNQSCGKTRCQMCKHMILNETIELS